MDKPTPCTTEDCNRPASIRGLCGRHYKHWRIANNPPCSVDGCDKQSVDGGMCRPHYAKHKAVRDGACSIVNCPSTVIMARGMCNSHYKRWYRYGDPLAGGVHTYTDPFEMFRNRTSWHDGCLVWEASLINGKNDAQGRGYGRMMIDGVSHLAHRWAYEQAHGPIPDGMIIDHICWNRACVNIDHLRAVTRKQNNAYRSRAQTNSSTGIRNVSKTKSGKYLVQVGLDGKHYGSLHADIDEAKKEAAELRLQLFGEYAGRG